MRTASRNLDFDTTKECSMTNMTKPLFAIILFVLTSASSFAEVRLPKILGSQMVLQRNSEVTIWGWAEAGEMVRISGDWLTSEATAKGNGDGLWQVKLKTADAGGPHTLTIAGTNTVKLDQILFGEVWIASGQSNMEMPLVKVSNAYTGIADAEKEVAAAQYPEIRLFQVGNFSSDKVLEDVEAGVSMYGIPPAECRWNPCSPTTIPTFASTAYFFARELHRELKVPIGIIDSTWGGTSAETWTPAPDSTTA
jgi:sialate O-acetylesterase